MQLEAGLVEHHSIMMMLHWDWDLELNVGQVAESIHAYVVNMDELGVQYVCIVCMCEKEPVISKTK